MDLEISDRLKPILASTVAFIENEIMPLDQEFLDEVNVGDRWEHTDRQKEILSTLKEKERLSPLVEKG